MIFVLFLTNSLLFLVALINFATMRRPLEADNIDTSILVLLPVRNEEENIARVLSELENQVNVPHLQVLVINDNSEDRTREIADRLTSSRISVMNVSQPEDGWLGKVNALQSAYLSSQSADVVISIDADVHFESDAIARAVKTLHASHLDFISPYPRQIADTWAERLAQPLLQWSWMSTVLLRGAERLPMKSTVICNGQFLVMKGASLKTINGFESVAHKVLDDIELGRTFVEAGFRGAVIDGSALSSTRMYSSFSQVRDGYGKSLSAAFGSYFGSAVAALFMATTAIFTFTSALTGNLLGIGATLAIIGTRIISAAASGTRIRDSFLHPFSAALFIYLLYFSWRNKGAVQWKGRTV